jgi:hypothetical protein
MAGITQILCTTFKSELLNKEHDLNTNTFKIALFKANASITGTYGATSTNYSEITDNSDETSGSGYSAGGATLTGGAIATSGTTAYVDFSDPSWTSSSFTTRGAMIYNTSNSNAAVCILDFGGDFTVTTGTFLIQFPAAGASTALIRIA